MRTRHLPVAARLPTGAVNTGSPWQWPDKTGGNRKGFPFSPVTAALSRGFPSTFPWHGPAGFPHLLLDRANWSAVNPLPPPSPPKTCGSSNYRATQASAQENHKMGLYGCAPQQRYRVEGGGWRGAPFRRSELKNALNY